MHKHKGFTLIELLIVLIVLGILASMMMIASGESVSTARANNIISNLRNYSLAAIAYYTDNADEFRNKPDNLSGNPKQFKINVSKYMHNEGNIPDNENYYVMNDNGTWWAGCKMTGASDSARIREKLQARAQSANLCGTEGETPPQKNNNNVYPAYNQNHRYVWLLIRSSTK